MKVLVTGSNGFLGKNLELHLFEYPDVDIVRFTRDQGLEELSEMLEGVDFVFHLAGINRPHNPEEFAQGNVDLTRALCAAIVRSGRKIPVVFSSSIQAALNNPYGLSKQAAEQALFELERSFAVPVYVFRLANVFGKWCRPNYNSAVATFCHNIARDLPIEINDPLALLKLVYVDDVVTRFIELLEGAPSARGLDGFEVITPEYSTNVGEVARQIQVFKDSRETLTTDSVGVGFIRALYATYLSYLPQEFFTYPVPEHKDTRGVFVEMLRTKDSGQFSYFTAYPGVTRGGHYHHTKTEKFLVIRGRARFRFCHMFSGERYERITSGDLAEIIETIPGWTHDITNMGSDELVVMLWANEAFDRARPDTYVHSLEGELL